MGPLLEEEELAALRVAIGQSVAMPQQSSGGGASFSSMGSSGGTSAGASAPSVDGAPVALIAEDRAASQARPNALRLATRWARSASRLLGRHGLKVEVHLQDAEIIDAAGLRDDLARCSLFVVGGQARPSPLLLAVSGRIIEDVAARALGAAPAPAGSAERQATAVALSLFTPTGEALARALGDAWHEEQGCRAALVTDPMLIARATTDVTAGLAVAVTLAVSGATTGLLRFLARPETLFVAPPPSEAVAVDASVIDEILGGVRVELAVELGSARLTMRELSILKPGSVLALDRFIDDRLPIRCQGVVVAEGRAMVARNNMAVEIVGPGSDRGAA